MFNKKYESLVKELAAMKEDMKTLKMAGEDDAMYELFVRETRRLLGRRPEIAESFKQRSAEEILTDLGLSS
ncbi:hypothetical protein [Vibrio agarivorans]|uniref:Uncharacterized protein n=1 Tax=Vibrio agarivorans TaxID=153622 RepID=A0ABT7Y7J2_9VIBR|nr:hypothetical protein [Vibrio agarivorans]MDN2484013.1 hypothetical protein [Vibrio agarivorans]